MKPPPDEADRFIRALESRGWEIRDDHIYSEKEYLHFPYPDGWFAELADLEYVMNGRRDRFLDPNQEQHLDPDVRGLLVRVHTEGLEAITEARGE